MPENTRPARLASRIFAAKAVDVPKRVASGRRAVEQVRSTNCIEGYDIVVPRHPTLVYDCGETAAALREEFKGDDFVTVEEVAGDQYVQVLNHVIGRHYLAGVWSLLMSPSAYQYCTRGNVSRMIEALESGAYATGLALEELKESVLRGEITNTFSGYDPAKLLSVGSFHCISADGEDRPRVGPNGEYRLSGVEEVVPLALLADRYGPGIAPIPPQRWEEWLAPDPVQDPEGSKKHLASLASKGIRKTAMLRARNLTHLAIANAVLPAYRISH